MILYQLKVGTQYRDINIGLGESGYLQRQLNLKRKKVKKSTIYIILYELFPQ